MKKTILTIMILVLAVTSVAMFAACGDKSQIKVISVNLTQEDYAFGVAKENTELLNQINTQYDNLKKDGTIDAIMAKYFEGGEPTEVKTYAEDKNKDQLVVATETGFAPFEYKDGNKLYGIDMEIMAEIAKKLNKELVVKDMDFAAVVTSVKEGLADVAAAALTVTESRSQSVNFSTTYYEASQVLIVKSDNKAFDECKSLEDVEKVIKTLPAGTKAAIQEGTTAGDFVAKFDNLVEASYKKVGLAANQLVSGGVGLIVVDKAPATAIEKSVNKK